MSYLFNKRPRRTVKKPAPIPTENNSDFNTGSKFLSQQGKLNQTVANSFQSPKKLRRVQLRGWK